MSAVGFRVEVAKWLALVRLLLGEVPEHAEFTAPGLAAPLAAYFGIAQAVRAGDLSAFRRARSPLLPMRTCHLPLLRMSSTTRDTPCMHQLSAVSAAGLHACAPHARMHVNCLDKEKLQARVSNTNEARLWGDTRGRGHVHARREVAEKHAAVFAADRTQNLIVRLQYNVIRAGLRRINLAYSRISLADVAARLGARSSLYWRAMRRLPNPLTAWKPPCSAELGDVRLSESNKHDSENASAQNVALILPAVCQAWRADGGLCEMRADVEFCWGAPKQAWRAWRTRSALWPRPSATAAATRCWTMPARACAAAPRRTSTRPRSRRPRSTRASPSASTSTTRRAPALKLGLPCKSGLFLTLPSAVRLRCLSPL
jgi:hypothetical protein